MEEMKLLLIIPLILSGGQVQGERKGEYGANCDENDFNSCDLDAALSCVASQCTCIYPWMIYDPVRVKCVSTVSQPCDIDPDVQFMDCVSHAKCLMLPNEYKQPFPQCVCDAKFKATAKHNCSDPYEQVAYYGESLPQICCPTK